MVPSGRLVDAPGANSEAEGHWFESSSARHSTSLEGVLFSGALSGTGCAVLGAGNNGLTNGVGPPSLSCPDRIAQEARHDVAVGLRRDLRIAVPQDALDGERRHAGGQEQRRGRMPQVVKPDVPREALRPQLFAAPFVRAAPLLVVVVALQQELMVRIPDHRSCLRPRWTGSATSPSDTTVVRVGPSG